MTLQPIPFCLSGSALRRSWAQAMKQPGSILPRGIPGDAKPTEVSQRRLGAPILPRVNPTPLPCQTKTKHSQAAFRGRAGNRLRAAEAVARRSHGSIRPDQVRELAQLIPALQRLTPCPLLESIALSSALRWLAGRLPCVSPLPTFRIFPAHAFSPSIR